MIFNKLAKKYNVNVHYIYNFFKILPPRTRRGLLLEQNHSAKKYILAKKKREINELAKKYNVNVHYIYNLFKILPPRARRGLLLEHSHSKATYGMPHQVSFWPSVEILFKKANKKDCYLLITDNTISDGGRVRGFYQIN